MHVILDPAVIIFDIVVKLYIYAIVIAAVLSWLISFNVVNPRNQFVYAILDTVSRITEPALRRIRRFMPNTGAIDLSPLVLVLAVLFIQMVVHQLVVYLP